MSDTPEPLTADEIADLKAKAKAATPLDGSTLFRYEHGGGRLLIDEGEKGRKLIADFYDESNREFYAAANPETIQRAIATIERQAEQIENAAYERAAHICENTLGWSVAGDSRVKKAAGQIRSLIQPPAQKENGDGLKRFSSLDLTRAQGGKP